MSERGVQRAYNITTPAGLPVPWWWPIPAFGMSGGKTLYEIHFKKGKDPYVAYGILRKLGLRVAEQRLVNGKKVTCWERIRGNRPPPPSVYWWHRVCPRSMPTSRARRVARARGGSRGGAIATAIGTAAAGWGYPTYRALRPLWRLPPPRPRRAAPRFPPPPTRRPPPPPGPTRWPDTPPHVREGRRQMARARLLGSPVTPSPQHERRRRRFAQVPTPPRWSPPRTPRVPKKEQNEIDDILGTIRLDEYNARFNRTSKGVTSRTAGGSAVDPLSGEWLPGPPGTNLIMVWDSDKKSFVPTPKEIAPEGGPEGTTRWLRSDAFGTLLDFPADDRPEMDPGKPAYGFYLRDAPENTNDDTIRYLVDKQKWEASYPYMPQPRPDPDDLKPFNQAWETQEDLTPYLRDALSHYMSPVEAEQIAAELSMRQSLSYDDAAAYVGPDFYQNITKAQAHVHDGLSQEEISTIARAMHQLYMSFTDFRVPLDLASALAMAMTMFPKWGKGELK